VKQLGISIVEGSWFTGAAYAAAGLGPALIARHEQQHCTCDALRSVGAAGTERWQRSADKGPWSASVMEGVSMQPVMHPMIGSSIAVPTAMCAAHTRHWWDDVTGYWWRTFLSHFFLGVSGCDGQSHSWHNWHDDARGRAV